MTKSLTSKLDKPLDKSLVQQREVDNQTVEFLEGHTIIRQANALIGFDLWSYEITDMTIFDDGTKLKKKYRSDDADVTLHLIGAQAIVKVTITSEAGQFCREDVGYGGGQRASKAASRADAGKEAVTSGLKRAMRTLGDQFGNGLYDKHIDRTWTPEADPDVLEMIKLASTTKALELIHKTHSGGIYNAPINDRMAELKKGDDNAE